MENDESFTSRFKPVREDKRVAFENVFWTNLLLLGFDPVQEQKKYHIPFSAGIDFFIFFRSHSHQTCSEVQTQKGWK